MNFCKSLASLASLTKAFIRTTPHSRPTRPHTLEPLESRALFTSIPHIPEAVLAGVFFDKTAYGVGDTVNAVYTFTNYQPNSGIFIPGLVPPSSVNFYLDQDHDNKITSADKLLGSGSGQDYKTSFQATGLPLGHHTILAQATYDENGAEPSPNHASITPVTLDIYRVVNAVPTPSKQPTLTFTDSHAGKVTARLTGPGSLRAFFDTPESINSDPVILQVLDSTLASSLRITLTDSPIGVTRIDTLTTALLNNLSYDHIITYPPGSLYTMSIKPYVPPTNHPLGSIYAPQVDITGTFEIQGKINSYAFHDISKANVQINGSDPITVWPQPPSPAPYPAQSPAAVLEVSSRVFTRDQNISVFFSRYDFPDGLPLNNLPPDTLGKTWFFLDTDNSGDITESDTVLGSDTRNRGVFSFSSAGLSLGKHTILSRVVPDSEPEDPFLSNKPTSSAEFNLYRTVPSVRSGNTSTLAYDDANANRVQVTLTGPGTLLAYFDTQEGVDANPSILRLIGSTSSSILAFSIPQAPSGFTSIDTITTSSLTDYHESDWGLWINVQETPTDLRAINAPCLNITGSLDISGTISWITLHDISYVNTTLNAPKHSKLALNINDILHSSITVYGGISTFHLNSWFNNPASLQALTATSIGSLLCQGDFSGSVTLIPNQSNQIALGHARINGMVSGHWNLTSSVASFSAGQAGNWFFSAPYIQSLTVDGYTASTTINAGSLASAVFAGEANGLSINLLSGARPTLGRLLVKGDATSISISSGFTAARAGRLTFAQSLTSSSIYFPGHIHSLTAGSIDTLGIDVISIGSLTTQAGANQLSINAASHPIPAGMLLPPTGIGSINIAGFLAMSHFTSHNFIRSIRAGSMDNCTIQASRQLGFINIFAGALSATTTSAGSIGSINVTSSILTAQIDSRNSIGSIYTGAALTGAVIYAAGSIGSISVGSILESHIAAGSSPNHSQPVMPLATIGSVITHDPAGNGPSFVHSSITAPRLGRISLKTVHAAASDLESTIQAKYSIALVTADNIPTIRNMRLGTAPFIRNNFSISVSSVITPP